MAGKEWIDRCGPPRLDEGLLEPAIHCLTILKRRLHNVCMHVHLEFSEGFAYALRRIRDCMFGYLLCMFEMRPFRPAFLRSAPFLFDLLFFDRLLSFDAF